MSRIIDRATEGGQRRSVPYNVILPLLESCVAFTKKANDQPSSLEVMGMLKQLTMQLENVDRNVAITKTTVNNINTSPPASTPSGGQAALRTWAKIVSDAGPPPTQSPIPSTSSSLREKDREIVIKMTDADFVNHLRSQSPTQLKDRINNAIRASGNSAIHPIRVISAKQLKSGDIATHTSKPEQATKLLAHADDWVKCLGSGAHAIVPTFGVIVHGIRTKTIDLGNPSLVAKQIRSENAGTIPNASITYVGWLTKAASTKTASSLVEEFTRAEDANAAIGGGLVWESEMMTSELYDKACRIKQCFRCYRYGHIGTQCSAEQKCGYCAGRHATKDCSNREASSPHKCAVCDGSHTA